MLLAGVARTHKAPHTYTQRHKILITGGAWGHCLRERQAIHHCHSAGRYCRRPKGAGVEIERVSGQENALLQLKTAVLLHGCTYVVRLPHKVCASPQESSIIMQTKLGMECIRVAVSKFS